MDHEYSTSALSDGQIGWDWFSVQLSDDMELMFFQLRRDDGSVDPFSSGTVIYPDGTTRTLVKGDFAITVLDSWRSPHSEADYPARWQVTIPSENLTLDIEPWLADQELQVSVIYWEGAVQVTGTHAGQTITGNGYVELTGYAEPFDGEF
jgi:predicted secreted hydrolase